MPDHLTSKQLTEEFHRIVRSGTFTKHSAAAIRWVAGEFERLQQSLNTRDAMTMFDMTTKRGICITRGIGCVQISDQQGNVIELDYDEVAQIGARIALANLPQGQRAAQPPQTGKASGETVVTPCPRCKGVRYIVGVGQIAHQCPMCNAVSEPESL